MKEETKNELKALWYDAKQGFKTTMLIIAIILAAGWLWNKLDAQTIEINAAQLSRMSDANQTANSIGINVSVPFNDFFDFAVDSEVSMGTTGYKTLVDNSSMVASLRADITNLLYLEGCPRIDLRAGIGWGHTFGSFVTDHNFHIYTIGMSVSKTIAPKTAIYISPMACWRTYAEHIGMRKNLGWVRFEMGIKYRIR